MERQEHAEYLFMMGDIYEALRKKGQEPTEDSMSEYKDMTVDQLKEVYKNILTDNQ